MWSYEGNDRGKAIPNKWQSGNTPESFNQKNTLPFPAQVMMVLIPPAKKALVEPSSWCFAPGLS
jgi:hypothetical protein